MSSINSRGGCKRSSRSCRDREQRAPLYHCAGVRSNQRFGYREQRLWAFSREDGSVIYSRRQDVRMMPRAFPEIAFDQDALFAAGEL
jgi:hypothetical protein